LRIRRTLVLIVDAPWGLSVRFRLKASGGPAEASGTGLAT